jgi:hypothetical protein
MLQAVDWLMLLHPVLAVVLVYPLLGMVLRLAAQTRDRRLNQAKLPPTVGRDRYEDQTREEFKWVELEARTSYLFSSH